MEGKIPHHAIPLILEFFSRGGEDLPNTCGDVFSYL
jgi:hypothetical protein